MIVKLNLDESLYHELQSLAEMYSCEVEELIEAMISADVVRSRLILGELSDRKKEKKAGKTIHGQVS